MFLWIGVLVELVKLKDWEHIDYALKMRAIPATPKHYLPLVSVDDLCKVMVRAATDSGLVG